MEMVRLGSEELTVEPRCAEGVLRLVGTNLLADERDGSTVSVEIVGWVLPTTAFRDELPARVKLVMRAREDSSPCQINGS